ncbi:MAG: DUF1849 family protein [Xanthobacteraceae bacterium]|nr:MAG: DUF1849 family protein [Xanthobacteraceae bacterium]
MRGREGSGLVRGVACGIVGATLATALGATPGSAAQTEAAMPFLPHQALYDLSLVKSRRSPSVDAVQGRIAYTFAGSACEGYTTEFRQVSRIEAGEGEPKLSDLRSISWEDGAGKSYRFHIETRMDNAIAKVVDGEAEQGAKGVVVRLKQPNKKTVTLDASTVFPTEQVRRILAAARAGKSLLELVVYDGSDNGEKLYNTLAVIGPAVPGDRATGKPDITGADSRLHKLTRWPVTVSYYDRSEESGKGEQTPVYAMSFELYENGVSRALTFDYNDFVVGGVMTRYDPQAAKPCK